MPANEIVWRAKVWEHTTRLAERSFLRRLRQSSLSARLAGAVRGRVPLCYAQPCIQALSPSCLEQPTLCVCVCRGVWGGGAVALFLEQPQKLCQ